jgi:uncharacterized protein (TIGR03437 family)
LNYEKKSTVDHIEERCSTDQGTALLKNTFQELRIVKAIRNVLWAAVPILFLFVCRPLHSQSLTTIWNFTANSTPGVLWPSNLVQGKDGNLYGVVPAPPTGSPDLMKLTTSGTLSVSPITLPGCNSMSLQASDGNFYGFSNALQGLCQITPSGSATLITAFNQGLAASGLSSTRTWLSIIQATDGFLYGTATGSAIMTGSIAFVWRMSLAGDFKLLATFPSILAQPGPGSSFVQGKDGNFYGTTNSATGPTIYKVTTSGVITTLYNSTSGIPYFLVPASDGAIYGITNGLGIPNQTVFFRVDSQGDYSTLYNFQITPSASFFGSVVVQGSDGNFYGTQPSGGSKGYGALYQISPQGAFSVAAEFGSSDDAPSTLINGSDGRIYGVTVDKTSSQTYATIFQFTPASSTSPPNTLPSISSGGIVSAGAFGGFTSISRGSWIELYGSVLGGDTRSWATSDFNGSIAPTSLDGISVTVGGQSAFIDFISPGQVNALVPFTVPTGPQPVIVTTPAGKSAPSTITVNALEPGLLAPASFVVGGVSYAVGIFADGTYDLPPGGITGVASRRAKPGDVLVLYGVGFGAVTPAIPAGQLVQSSNSLATTALFSVGGIPATTTYAGLAPGYTGLYQFNLVVPNVAPNDAAPITFTLGGTAGTQKLYLAIGN